MPNPRPAPLLALVAFAITALSILPLASAQNGGNFLAGINYSTGFPTTPTDAGYYQAGIIPVQVLTGDFNGDGKLDLVEAVSCEAPYLPDCPTSDLGYPGVIAVYLGDGDGKFGTPILTGTGLRYDSIRAIAVGDFNNDGKLDVAAASDDEAPGSITILLGNGAGGFEQTSQFAMNGRVDEANTLAVGDFNRDGKLDLVAGLDCYGTSCASHAIAVYLGDGAGNLDTPTYYPSLATNQLVPVVADFNGDGKPDVVVTGWYSSNDGIHSYMTVLLNAGNGTFNNQGTIAIPVYAAEDAVTADFNGDGKMDLAIVTPYGYGTNILFGNGNGTFQAPVSYPPDSFYSLTVTDVNGDGKPDLVVATGAYYTNAVTPLINNGTGVFTVGATYPLGGWNTASVVAGDFNGDGKQDVVLTSSCSETSQLDNHCPDGTLSVLLGNGDGTMQSAVPATVTIVPHHQVLVDMNGDGIPDMVGTEDAFRGNESTGESAVVVALGIGDGRFGPSVEYPSGLSLFPYGLAVADINNDGYPDVVVNGSAISGSDFALAVMLGSKGGGLGSPTTYALPMEPRGAPAIGDFAGNKKIGVAVVQESENGEASGVGILLGNGDGTLQAEKFTQTSEIYPEQVVVGDFNHDGRADVAAFGIVTISGYQSVGAVTAFLGNGDGTLTVKQDPDHNPTSNPLANCNGCVVPASYPSFGLLGSEGFAGYSPLALADVNGDGNLDLVIANECRMNDSGCSTGALAYFPGNGDGTFNDAENNGPAQQLPDANYLGVSAADVNGDGKPDIIASTLSGVAVYLAPFTAPGTIYATSGITDAEIPAIGDINGDGAPDIAIAGGSGVVDLLFNRFPRDKSTTTTLTSSANPAAVGQPITFTATVTPASGPTPTGSVTFTHSGVDTTVPLTNGVATLTVSNLTVATGHPILAVYSGSTSDSASTSNQVTQAVLIPTTTTLTSSANPATLGQPITFTATVSATSGTTPTGNVVFSHSGSVYATVALSNGVATYATSTLTAATGHPVVATYAGAELDASSVSNQVTQAVLIPTTTALVSSANPALLSQPITFTATVTATSGATPTGNVTFSHSGTAYATVALNNGVATYTTSSLTAATGHPFLATYAGAGLDAGSVSNQVTQAVLIPTATVLSSSLNPATSGQSVTLTAKVTASSGATPTGTVTFMNGSKTLGTGTLTSGVATYTTSTLPTGTLSLTAVYAKNGVDAASTSTALKETINP